MESTDGRILLIILVATVLFAVGRNFQRTVDTWAGWGKAIKAAAEAAAKVPPAKSAARAAFWRMVMVGAVTFLLLALIANAIRYR
ncbi:hypothetical protein Sme01_70400 [Sphaerisporangium melleum]|uniref:Uncharacterized protein n=1 Tax=Sphaerisporangium melleum TaxID=321316 RepID=A0A917RN21_9ACTN|nr:hypothetical protein [Sphaerisporangium melleum]GGL15477.1 hypothetical protein GCM10007964_66860 [Sphaerisporangium melleum]GII74564.1 hypothetical protein Sme01_70400 [Sphaerisporangium melleum]